MKKIIRKVGRNICIILTPEELEAYDLNLGDIVDIELVKISEPKIRGDNVNNRTPPTIQKKRNKNEKHYDIKK